MKIKRDRCVSRDAGAAGGVLQTPLLILDAAAMTLNVDASQGDVKVQVLDRDNTPSPGFALADCRLIRSDGRAGAVVGPTLISQG